MDKLKSIYASAYSAAVTILTVVAVTIGAELSSPFKNWLAQLTGHHWITKSWVVLIVFILTYGILQAFAKSPTALQTKKALSTLVVVSILGFFALLGFYIYEFLAI